MEQFQTYEEKTYKVYKAMCIKKQFHLKDDFSQEGGGKKKSQSEIKSAT